MYSLHKIKYNRGYLALFGIAIFCAALFWLAIICLAGLFVFPSGDVAAAQILNQQFAYHESPRSSMDPCLPFIFPQYPYIGWTNNIHGMCIG